MDAIVIVASIVSISFGQEITKATEAPCGPVETPEPTMRTIDNLKAAYDEFKRLYCEATLSLSQIKRLDKCEDIAHGKAVASSRRVCFVTMALPEWKNEPGFGLQVMKQKWCEDTPYNERIDKCLRNKIKTLPSSLYSQLQYRPQGLVTTGWKAVDCRRKIIEF